tara:strand:+ start:3697 stop:4944 length:1248 start_codon:yes stop_codon:yes gene_type:complete
MLGLKNFFLSKYVIISPRTNSFGGVFEFYLGIKFANFQKKKFVFAVPLINLHPKHKKKRIFGLYLIYYAYKKLDFISKLISFFFTLVLNINLLLIKSNILTVLDYVFFNKKKKIRDYFPMYYGYDFGDTKFQEFYENQKKNNLDIGINWNNLLYSNIDEYIPKADIKKSQIIVFIKDINYHKLVAQGSKDATSDIENYRESFNLLLNNNYVIHRAGDKTQKSFNITHKNFLDSTKRNYSLKTQYHNYLNSEIYFGNGGSTLQISGFFKKPRILSNLSFEYLWHPTDQFSHKDMMIFKKVYCKKNMKILSFQEILNLDLDYLKNKDNFILLENNKTEITDLTKVFLQTREEKRLENFTMAKEFNQLIKNFNEKNIERSIIYKIYNSSYYMVPDFFLKKYLYPNENLIKESLDIKFN